MSFSTPPKARLLPFCQAQVFDGEKYHRCGEYVRDGEHDIHKCECSFLWADEVSPNIDPDRSTQ